jgi:hypothetical protein
MPNIQLKSGSDKVHEYFNGNFNEVTDKRLSGEGGYK